MPRAREAIGLVQTNSGGGKLLSAELQNHGIRTGEGEPSAHGLAKEFGLKLVATNDVHYVEKSHSHAHDCLVWHRHAVDAE